MAEIQMSYDAVNNLSQEFTRNSEEGRSIIQSLTSAIEQVADAWVGSAYDSFKTAFDGIKPRLEKFCTHCDTVSGQLGQAANIIRENDSSIGSTISNLEV